MLSTVLTRNPPGSSIVLCQRFPIGRVFQVWGEHLQLPVNGDPTYACQLLVYRWVHIPLGFCQLWWPEIHLVLPSFWEKHSPTGEFFMFWRHIPLPCSMAMPAMHVSSWYIVGYISPLDSVNFVGQKSLWIPHHYVQNLPLGRVFHDLGEHTPLLVNAHGTHACQLLIYHCEYIYLRLCSLCCSENHLIFSSFRFKHCSEAQFSPRDLSRWHHRHVPASI